MIFSESHMKVMTERKEKNTKIKINVWNSVLKLVKHYLRMRILRHHGCCYSFYPAIWRGNYEALTLFLSVGYPAHKDDILAQHYTIFFHLLNVCYLKGQSHEIFCNRSFPPNNSSWSHLTCPRAVSIFFAYWLSYGHFKMTPRCPMCRNSWFADDPKWS